MQSTVGGASAQARGGGAQCAGARRRERGRAAVVLNGRQSYDGRAPPDPRNECGNAGDAQSSLRSERTESLDDIPDAGSAHTTCEAMHLDEIRLRIKLMNAATRQGGGHTRLHESITLWPLPIMRPSESAGRVAVPCLRFMKPTILKVGGWGGCYLNAAHMRSA